MIAALGHERLQAVAEKLQSGASIEPLTVREFLSWFGAKRRGWLVVSEIQSVLQALNLTTDPDFESTYIDGQIEIRHSEQPASEGLAAAIGTVATVTATFDAGSDVTLSSLAIESIDPTHRISKLAAANSPPISVHPDASLQEAVTIMLSRGFSQMPVMTTSREVKGVVSWQSIGARMAVGMPGTTVKDLMEQHHEVRHDASIFQVIPTVVASDYVLVRGRDNTISGIITASDLSLQFLQLSEPFLLLSEIENLIRQVIAKRFELADLAGCRDPLDSDRSVERVADLTFGEYVRLLENPENWYKSKIPLDRMIFCKQLGVIRDIRNDVMHFDPDGISAEDLEKLREFGRFLQRLSAMGVA